MGHASRIFTLSLLLASAPASAFNIAQCLANNSKAECSRQMMIEEDNSKPVAAGDELAGVSGKYTVKVAGENWLKNSHDDATDHPKDLALIKDSGIGRIDFDVTNVAEADFEPTITSDMKGLFSGLQKGFRAGRIAISKSSEMEILPLTITAGGSGLLGRFCYHIDIKNGKSVCVYEGFIGRGGDESYKFLGSIGDYDDLRTEMENIITSFKFKE